MLRFLSIRSVTIGIGLAALGAFAAVSWGDERDRICRPGYAHAQRLGADAWLRLRQQAFARAGVSFPARHADYETDHIVPLCLGGTNDLDNLQLQPWAIARVKDVYEAETCRAYCAGKVTLD